MQLDTMGKFKGHIDVFKGGANALANAGMEKAQELLAQMNQLLRLLESAGYGVASLDIELSLAPKVTMKLKTGPAVREEKLNDILREHADQTAITLVVASLIQANKLRGSVTVETLALDGIEIILTTTPNITMQWKDKDKTKNSTAA
jgi:hypothetical protein